MTTRSASAHPRNARRIAHGALARRGILSLIAIAVLLGTLPAGAGVLTGNCRVANQPAATLLIPYFQVDVDNAGGSTTLISINNASAKSELARVTLWTDWGVPTLAFDVYLTGYDVQTVNLRDVFQGVLPVTGAGAPQGAYSLAAAPPFSGCATGTGPSGQPGISDVQRAYLRAAHTGQPLPGAATGFCAGSGTAGPSLATGYVTVDSVTRCTAMSVGTLSNTPADGTYFAHGGTGLASDDNVLWGDYLVVDPQRGLSEGQTAVALVADPDFFGPGDYTFYGRYVGFDGRDDRAPLSSLYYARYLNGGSFAGGTDLVVWRDNRRLEVAPSPCASGPSWAPLGEYQLVVFDEEENGQLAPKTHAFPLTTQRVHLGSSTLPAVPNYGWLMLDLWHTDGTHAQGYVSILMTADGRYQVGHPALQADDLCVFGP